MRAFPTRLLPTAAVAVVLAVVLGAATVEGDDPAPATGDTAAPATGDTAAPATGDTAAHATGDPRPLAVQPVRPRPPAPRPAVDRTGPLAVAGPAPSIAREGWLVAAGSSSDPVDGGGSLVRWTFEVEQGIDVDVDEALTIAEEALYDARSWARDHRLERVDDPDDAGVRVLVARPSTVDGLCARAGLATNGRFSCWNGRVAAINLDRWTTGVDHVPDLALYRTYVVNHEVGHALGRDHRGCPATGTPADVMQQQTKTLAGCVANPWPHPGG